MNVTERLLRVFQVDQQLRGLQSRLHAAERFLEEQDSQLAELDAKAASLEGQSRQSKAQASNHEGEANRLDERLTHLRTQMDASRTNKEYKAFLTEVNTIKADRSRVEEEALTHLTKLDELKKQLDEVQARRAERTRVREVAVQDRDRRAAEIKGRVEELKNQRRQLATDVAADVLAIYESLVRDRGEDAMAALEELDRRRHEYHCSACMMALPVEAVNRLRSTGALTRCSSCGTILYIEASLAQELASAKK